ncbi:MAG: C40 family peptidase [Muribaculaceae bacterium]|nr:C40 family peptidase [Muribaculaceae bacterium]
MKSRLRISLMLMTLMAIVCSCGTSKRAQQSTEDAIISDLQGLLIEQGTCERLLLTEAFGWQGTPYKSGGTTRRGVDCSGFVMQTYVNSLGIKLPRTSAAQAKFCKKIKKKDMVPGDLVFFNTSGKDVSHVGIYIGQDRFIHASSSKGVIVSHLDQEYWHKRLVQCGRVPPYTALLKREHRIAKKQKHLSTDAHVLPHRSGGHGIDLQAPAHLGCASGQGVAVGGAEYAVSAVAYRAFGVSLAANDPDAHISAALHRTGHVISHGDAVDVARQQHAAVARLSQLGVRKARGLPLGLDEVAVIESAAHAVHLPLADGVEWHVHGRRRYAVVIDGMAAGGSHSHQQCTG